MIRILRQFSRLAVLLAGASLAVPVSAAGGNLALDTRPRASDEALRMALEKIRQEHGVPGLAAAVFDRDTIRTFAAGKLGAAGGEVTSESRFRIGQASILFTGMAMGALIADGSIPAPPADELRELAPEIDLHNPWLAERPVHVADLLAHRAGMGPVHFRDVYTASRNQPLLAGINSAFRALRLEYRPGDEEQFSVLGPAIAAYLMEKSTGFSYEDVLARMFFEPLALSATVGRVNGPLPGDASGHAGRPATPAPALPLNFVTAGGAWISAADLARIGQLLLNRGSLAGREILDPEAIRWLEAPADDSALVPGERHGVRAEAFNGFLFFTQTGALPGFLARFAYSPELGRGYLVLMNYGRAGDALEEADALLRGQLMGGALPPAPSVPPPAAEAANLPALAGWYRKADAERPPRALYQAWVGLARVTPCNDAWCFSSLENEAMLEPFDGNRLRETGDWYPGWEVSVTEAGLVLNGAGSRWQHVPGWQAAGAVLAAALAIAGIAMGLVLLPFWTVSLARRRIADYRELLPRFLPLSAILAVVIFQALLFATGYPALGVVSTASVAILVFSIAVPLLALLALAASVAGVAWGLPRSAALPAVYMASAAAIAAVAMVANGLFAFQTWNY